MLLPTVAVRPARLSWLAILCALSLIPIPLVSAPAHSTAGATPRWSWPIAAPHPVIRPFIAPQTRYSAGHRGIDIASASGSPVVSPADGVVYFAGVVVDRPVLSIRHADGLVSSFEPVLSSLVAGAVVYRGQTIGTLEPGHCASTCLHFGVRRYGAYVSPLLYLTGIEHSILLPTKHLG